MLTKMANQLLTNGSFRNTNIPKVRMGYIYDSGWVDWYTTASTSGIFVPRSEALLAEFQLGTKPADAIHLQQFDSTQPLNDSDILPQ